MMINGNERREVARRLRDKKAECEERGYPWMCDDLILALGYDHDYEAGDEIFDRLADLIEPQPITEGEPPYNLYSLYEAVLRRHPRSEYAIEDDEVDELVDALLDICNAPGYDVIQRLQPSEQKVKCVAEVKIDGEQLEELVHDAAVKLTGIDRDALLALADEIKSDTSRVDELQLGIYGSCYLSGISRRIREALGVTDG